MIVTGTRGEGDRRRLAGAADAISNEARVFVAIEPRGEIGPRASVQASPRASIREARTVWGTEAVVRNVQALRRGIPTAIVRAKGLIITGSGRAAHTVSPAAGIVHGAELPVTADPRKVGAQAGSRGRIARVTRAGIPIVAIHGRMGALSRRRIAEILRAQVSIPAVLGRSLAYGASRRGDAGVVRGALAPIVTRSSRCRRSSLTFPRLAAAIRSSTGIHVVAGCSRGLGRPDALHHGAGHDLAGVGLRARVPVAARGSGGKIHMYARPELRAGAGAHIIGTGIVVVTVPWIVAAGSRRCIAGIDRAEIQIGTVRAGDLQRRVLWG